MHRLQLGDEVWDLTRRILVVGPDDRERLAQIEAAGVLDLGPATPEGLRRLARPGEQPVMMTFGADQLPELAVAVARGVRVVRMGRVVDVAAAAKVCRMAEALLETGAAP